MIFGRYMGAIYGRSSKSKIYFYDHQEPFVNSKQGTTFTFAATYPSRASEIHLSLVVLQLSHALEKVNVSFKTKQIMVLACKSIFSRTSLHFYQMTLVENIKKSINL